jgi:hypothetical protein
LSSVSVETKNSGLERIISLSFNNETSSFSGIEVGISFVIDPSTIGIGESKFLL